MVLSIEFDMIEGVIRVSDTTTPAPYTGTVTIVHPDGFVSTLPIEDGESPSTAIRTDSNGNYLKGDYSFTYVNDAGVDESLVIDFCYVKPTIEVECTVDYICSKLTSRDVTDYTQVGVPLANTTVVRTHTVAYPNATELANIVSSAQNVVVNPIYSGVFTTIISSDVEWVFDNYSIVDTVKGSKDCDVDEDNRLCTVLCCMKESYKRWQNAKCLNAKRAGEYEAAFRDTASIATLAYLSLSCGSANDVAGYVEAAKAASGCSDCDCEGSGAGTLIVALCGDTSVSGVEGSASINVSEGGVISVNETWLTTFVNNLIAALDLTALQLQVDNNTTLVNNIDDILGTVGLYAYFNTGGTIQDIVTLLDAINLRFANHRLASFSYRFEWDAGVVTDNLDGDGRVIDPNAVLMNSALGNGFFQRPKITWVSASSFDPAKLTVELIAFDGTSVADLMTHVNVHMNVGFADTTMNTTKRDFKAYVVNVKNNDPNALTFDVVFEGGDLNLPYAMNYFANSLDTGVVHLSFNITGKKLA
jgi:hypothetical protein